MRFGRHRTRLRRGLIGVAVALLVLPGLARSEDEPPAPAPPVVEPPLIAGVVSDPGGEATRLAGEALAALAADDPDGAFERLVRLADEYGDVLVPVSLLAGRAPGRADGALRWPAVLVANHALASLGPELREKLNETWAPRTSTLWARVRRGDDDARTELANRYPATRRGSRALLLTAERDLEAGRRTTAARALQRWLDLNYEADPRTRAQVVMRLADALSGLDDAGALDAVQVLHRDLRSIVVRAGGEETTLADRIGAWRARKPEAPLPPEEAPAFDVTGATPVMLWSRSLVDPGLLVGDRPSQGELSVRAGAWGEGNTLVIHEGRRLRRLDLRSGLERWRFPAVRLATLHDPRERYATYDLPFRSVTPAPGGRILAVLGDPPATGRYAFLSQEYDADELGQECRPRLVCVDLESGELRWLTGAAHDLHPVLGDSATGCASPPLVVGDRVYCLFARTQGATAFYLACLHLASGAPVWVQPLASGESGRNDDRAGTRDRFTGKYLQSVPWGARPSLHDGEVCVVPHAGFAAGLGAQDGTLRWLRALPRFSLDVPMPANLGHSVRNAPLPWGDAWLLAPMDSPHMLCLARETGDLRWQRGPSSRQSPVWRDLLGIVPNSAGRPELRLSGMRPMTMSPADGAVLTGDTIELWEVLDGDPAGASLDLGRDVVFLGGGALQAHRWHADPTDDPGRIVHLLEEPEVPMGGDLYCIGDVLVVVGLDRVAALAVPPKRWRSRIKLMDNGLDVAGDAAERGLLGVLDGKTSDFTAAIKDARLVTGPMRERVHQRLGKQFERAVIALQARDVADDPSDLSDAEIRVWTAAVRDLPMAVAGPALLRLTELLFDRELDSDAAELLLYWAEHADDTLVAAEDTPGLTGGLLLRDGRIRGDLIAHALLRHYASRIGVRRVLEKREGPAERAIRKAMQDEAALRAALQRHAGTRAVDLGRRHLARMLSDKDRHADAAAVVADRRLDPPWLDEQEEAGARLVRAARLQLEEAEILNRAGDGHRARTLVGDLLRWVPGGAEGTIGRSAKALRSTLRARYGWFPMRGGQGPELDVWRGVEPPKDTDALRSVEFLGLTGPGAHRDDKLLTLVRGLTVEVWSLETRARLVALPGGDEGWFGGSLTSIDRWVPGGGIRVTSIVAGEPADASGVQAGDWVRTWNGTPVYDLSTFMNLVASSKPGVEIDVSVHRRGQAVMDRFTAGRRPPSQGRMLDYEDIYADAAGRLLVPGRTGLSWVDPAGRTRTALWTWREPGVVRRASVLGDRAYVTIQRGLQPDVIVAVDIERGTEIWRRSVRGGVSRVEAVGSAIWVQASAPAHALLLDRHDGRVRGDYRCFDFHRHEFRKNWSETPASAAAVGRGYVISGWWGRHALHVVNTTTGRVEHAESWDHGPGRRGFSRYYVNPQVAASAFVAVIKPPGLRLFLPDPLGRSPLRRVDVDPKSLMANQGHYGRIDSDTRIFVRGDTLYLLRVPIQGRQNVNLGVFGASFAELGRGSTTDLVSGGGFHMRTKRSWMQGSALPTRYVLDARPHFEGIFVTAARLAGDHRTESWWISALRDDGDERNLDVRFRSEEVQEARRPLPARIGPRLLVPTDKGAQIFKVQQLGR